jgi:uncharacterized protein YjdB
MRSSMHLRSSTVVVLSVLLMACGGGSKASPRLPGGTTATTPTGTGGTGATGDTGTPGTPAPPPELTGITLAPESLSVPPGFPAEFVATGTFSDASSGDVSADLTWTSSDPAVATMSTTPGDEGLAMAVGPGTATITATDPATGLHATATVTVRAVTPAIASIAVTTATPAVALGLTAQFRAIATMSDSTTVDVTTIADWSSSDLRVATIASGAGAHGVATTLGTGATSITARLNGVVSTAATLTVTAAVLELIEISPESPTLAAGTDLSLSAYGVYTDDTLSTDASAGHPAVSITWGTSNASVVTVSTTGLLHGVAPGSATITATEAGGLSRTAMVTVTAPGAVALSFVSISPGSVRGGNNATGRVELTAPSSIDSVISLASSTTSATVPATVTIPAGSRAVTFTVGTVAPENATKRSRKTRATITATFDDDSKFATLNIRR